MTDQAFPAQHAWATGRPHDSPPDPALPGSRLLQRPTEFAELLSSLLADWLGADTTLLDTQVGIRHYVPGKRYVAEGYLTIRRRGGPLQSRRLMIKLYPGDKGPVIDLVHWLPFTCSYARTVSSTIRRSLKSRCTRALAARPMAPSTRPRACATSLTSLRTSMP